MRLVAMTLLIAAVAASGVVGGGVRTGIHRETAGIT